MKIISTTTTTIIIIITTTITITIIFIFTIQIKSMDFFNRNNIFFKFTHNYINNNEKNIIFIILIILYMFDPSSYSFNFTHQIKFIVFLQ